MNKSILWQRYREYLIHDAGLGISLDVSRMHFGEGFLVGMKEEAARALREMEALEKGAVANPDENRMVGHYWLRNPALAPTPDIAAQIGETVREISAFAEKVHRGEVTNPAGERFTRFMLVGIGGSALGPQLVADALGNPRDPMKPYFIDNTDPDGIDRVIAGIGEELPRTLCLVISKSGGTKETRNGMLEVAAAYRSQGLAFASHAVAVTGAGSALDEQAESEGWLARFPMWDWVGGRTSVTSAVGLLPAALQGIDINGFLEGARLCDEWTRVKDLRNNPALLMALMWHYATAGEGRRDMVLLPYRDRLLLFSRYLQQLVMESLGKEKDLSGNVVHQGLSVYGNKGSTDQHAYVQQLREGVNNFFVTFIAVLRDREGGSMEVDPATTSGDYLHGFLLGTREALCENHRESMTVTVQQLDARTLGALVALYERAVGFYASLVWVNAYHQPGVEAGKKAAERVLELQRRVLGLLRETPAGLTAEQAARALGLPEEAETLFHILEHLRANVQRGIEADDTPPLERTYRLQ